MFVDVWWSKRNFFFLFLETIKLNWFPVDWIQSLVEITLVSFTRGMQLPFNVQKYIYCSGVERVLFDDYDEVLKIIGSADDDVIYQAVKYARKGNPGHHHYWPRKIHLLSSYRSPTYFPSTRYASSWNQPIQYRVSHSPGYLYGDESASWIYGDTYGPASFGYAAQSPYSAYYSPRWLSGAI